jgi:hypothetical protein
MALVEMAPLFTMKSGNRHGFNHYASEGKQKCSLLLCSCYHLSSL